MPRCSTVSLWAGANFVTADDFAVLHDWLLAQLSALTWCAQGQDRSLAMQRPIVMLDRRHLRRRSWTRHRMRSAQGRRGAAARTRDLAPVSERRKRRSLTGLPITGMIAITIQSSYIRSTAARGDHTSCESCRCKWQRPLPLGDPVIHDCRTRHPRSDRFSGGRARA
jgi:hypothetical protein